MADQSPDSVILKVIGSPILAALGALITWLAGSQAAISSALISFVTVLGGVCGLVFSLMYGRYVGVLGAGSEPEGSAERRAYDALRASLVEGGLIARLYAQRLTGFLDAVDRFFGDAAMANRTLFPHAFGLKTPAPLWTPPAFDRCLLLALIYPLAAILLIWGISGRVGPAETALGLKPDLSAWWRGLATIAFGLAVYGGWRAWRVRKTGTAKWYLIAILSLSAATSTSGSFAISTVAGVIWGSAVAVDHYGGRIQVAYFGGIGCAALAVGGAVSLSLSHLLTQPFIYDPSVLSIVYLVLGIILGIGTAPALIVTANWLNNIAIKQQWQGAFQLFFVFAMVLACLSIAGFSDPLWIEIELGAWTLFVGLLSLLNAPFEWLSLGLTRALLRRGLELGGWWPYLLGFVDAFLAAAIVASLAIVMVVGVQAFDDIVVHRGGKRVLLPLDTLLEGIAAYPTEPQYWWVYALLLSTMIPSLINLIIGGASFVRGVPGLPSLLLRFMPVGEAVPAFDRAWLALVLTVQGFTGAFLGIAAQALLVIGLIGYVMPWLGLSLLDRARAVVDFNLPLQVGQFVEGVL